MAARPALLESAKSADMKAHQRIPPKVPEQLPQLQRAVVLLGERCKYPLGAKLQRELTDLLGRYPDAETAAIWKTALKQLRRDEIFQR